MENETILVYCTVPNAKAGQTIAETLVKEHLCACVNCLPGVRSHYIYEGEYCKESEELLLIKSTKALFDRLQARIETLHPYRVPEIIAVDITNANEAYLQWLHSSIL